MFLMPPDFSFTGDVPAIPKYEKHFDPRQVKVGNSNDSLIKIDESITTWNIYNDLSLPQRNSLHLRSEVLERLIQAQNSLPEGFELMVLDGHRTRQFQASLMDYYTRLYPDLMSGYVSDPNDNLLVPPHTTGGAVDLTLSIGGRGIALGTDYDSFDDEAWIDYLDINNVESNAASLRRVLYHAMIKVGFAPYPLEWWHWSYGDQWWAAFYGYDASIYPEAI